MQLAPASQVFTISSHTVAQRVPAPEELYLVVSPYESHGLLNEALTVTMTCRIFMVSTPDFT